MSYGVTIYKSKYPSRITSITIYHNGISIEVNMNELKTNGAVTKTGFTDPIEIAVGFGSNTSHYSCRWFYHVGEITDTPKQSDGDTFEYSSTNKDLVIRVEECRQVTVLPSINVAGVCLSYYNGQLDGGIDVPDIDRPGWSNIIVYPSKKSQTFTFFRSNTNLLENITLEFKALMINDDYSKLRQWSYYEDKDMSKQPIKTSQKNPNTDSGVDDVFISAIVNLGYKLSDINIYQTAYMESFELEPYTTYQFEITFNYSGAVQFYTTGDSDPYGQLSSSGDWNDKMNGCVFADRLKASDDIDYENGNCNFSITYTVQANTTYYLFVRDSYGYNTGRVTLHITSPYVPPTQDTIEKWDWNISNEKHTANNGGASLTKKAYKAITKVSGYTLDDFSHHVWNDMVEKVSQLLEVGGESWVIEFNNGDKFLSCYDTYMRDGDTDLTADRFNSLRRNIGPYGTITGIPTKVSKGDIVYGWYFEELVNGINDWIDKQNNG